ncbi:hypothetical protein GCM10009789_01190 [Kribbella sancticallisti]|uniref:DinB superfamily protein n=1 Tax=Kribbella sancticallisti TaxID=460087 RepID=A0ABN2C310_9ACTN
MITPHQYVYFVSKTLNAMTAIVAGLGDDLANQKPDLPGANTPYALLNHSLGAIDFWAGQIVSGRPVQRDRDAEFLASGPVQPLIDRAGTTLARLTADAQAADVRAEPQAPVPLAFPGLDEPLDRGGALFHLYTDLVQHLGQLELTRDVLNETARLH